MHLFAILQEMNMWFLCCMLLDAHAATVQKGPIIRLIYRTNHLAHTSDHWWNFTYLKLKKGCTISILFLSIMFFVKFMSSNPLCPWHLLQVGCQQASFINFTSMEHHVLFLRIFLKKQFQGKLNYLLIFNSFYYWI